MFSVPFVFWFFHRWFLMFFDVFVQPVFDGSCAFGWAAENEANGATGTQSHQGCSGKVQCTRRKEEPEIASEREGPACILHPWSECRGEEKLLQVEKICKVVQFILKGSALLCSKCGWLHTKQLLRTLAASHKSLVLCSWRPSNEPALGLVGPWAS